MLIIEIIYNLAILVTVSAVSAFIEARWSKTTSTGKMLQGITFGLIAILAMLNPYELSPGIIFDGRSIVLSLCALFFGPVAGGIAGVMAIVVRMAIGGPGAVMGVSVISSSTAIGLIFYAMRRRHKAGITALHLYVFGILVHIVMLLLMMFLPKNFVWLTFKTIAISVITLYPLATVIIGKILIDEENRGRLFNEVRESEKKLKQLSQAVEQSPVSIVITDTAGTIEYVNPKFIEITEYSRDEVIGKNPRVLKSGHTPSHEYDRLWEMLMSGQEWNGEFHNRKKSGELYWEFARVSPIINANGETTHFLAVKEDITERKRAQENLRRIEERLRQSEKMEAVGQLAGGIAHDFNNVLGGIIGFTDLSLGLAEKGSVLEANLEKVLKAADRAKHLVKQILAFSRQGNPQKSTIGLRPIVEEVLDMLRPSIPSSVIIKADLSADTKPVLADATQIHQALLNLATNSVQAMNRKGTLRVGLHSASLETPCQGQSGEIMPGEYTVLVVADTGCGMDAGTLSRVFEPFFTTKAVGEGTGMGLSVVLGIVQSHGGDIQMESAVGQGTTIRIYLPAAENAEIREAATDARGRSLGTERVLYVDDEEMLVDMADHMLAPLGYSFTGMTSSLEALEYIRHNSDAIDIVVTDQTMPSLSGLELAAEAVKIRQDLPIILCTGFSSEVNAERAAANGISRLLLKPYGAREISNAIREVVDSDKPDAHTS